MARGHHVAQQAHRSGVKIAADLFQNVERDRQNEGPHSSSTLDAAARLGRSSREAQNLA